MRGGASRLVASYTQMPMVLAMAKVLPSGDQATCCTWPFPIRAICFKPLAFANVMTGSGIGVSVAVAVSVGVSDGVLVGVAVSDGVRVRVGVAVKVGDAVKVGVAVLVGSLVLVG